MPEIISDSTFDMLATLLNKLEALEAYETYLEDMTGENRQLMEQIAKDDERHARMLKDAIEKMAKSGGLK